MAAVLVCASLATVTLVLGASSPAAAAVTDCPTSTTQCTATFTYTGAVESFVVPVGVVTIRAAVYGAQGGKSKGVDSGVDPSVGGLGGRTAADIPVVPGQTLRIVVGQAGKGGQGTDKTTTGTYGGGGVPGQTNGAVSGSGGSGGGGSFVFGPGTSNLLVAAGGGGGAGSGTAGGAGAGSAAGATAGGNGTHNAGGGKAATLTAGGAGGVAGTNGKRGAAGTGPATAPTALGLGGNGGAGEWSGGGGGGYRGGGGGGTDGGTVFPKYEGAGGGGRGFLVGTGSLVSSDAGTRSGNGLVTLTWERQATVTLTKAVNGRLVPADQFTLTLADSSGSTAASVTTTGTQTTASTAATPVVRGQTYIITDRLTDASPSQPSDYTGTLSCVTENGVVTAPSRPPIGVWALTIGSANTYTCTISNTADAPNPELTMVKSVAPSSAADFTAGTTLTYSFLVTNTGNVAIDNISIAEVAFSGAGTASPPTCAQTTLVPGAETTCTSTYTLQAADVTAGTLTNTARADGTAPGGAPVSSAPDDAVAPTNPAPALDTVKTAQPQYALGAGDTIGYTYTVTNTGNVSVNNVAIAEDTFTGSGTLAAASCDLTVLLPGEFATCTAQYTTAQADLDAGDPLVNTAHATGTAPGGATINSTTDAATVLMVTTPELTLDKAVTPGVVDADGDTVTYQHTITNTGNVTISAISVAEDTFTGTGPTTPPTCTSTILAPGDDTTCTTTYTLTQDDIDSGALTNIAHAAGTGPDGGGVTSTSDNAVVEIVPTNDLVLAKSVSPTSVDAAGDSVTYTYDVTNNGTATVTNLNVGELDFTGTGTLPDAVCAATTLAPTASTTCTSTYVATAADFNTASIDNLAQVTANDPGGAIAVSGQETASVTVIPPPGTVSLTLSKTAQPTRVRAAGDVITYTFRVTNTGTALATDVAIAEGTFTGTGDLPTPTCPTAAANLAPGDTVTCTTRYRVRRQDLNGRGISNTARATASGPGGTSAVSSADGANVAAPAAAAGSPRVRGRTSDSRVVPGEAYRDRVRISGLAPGSRVSVTARLYGPFSTKAALSCQPRHLTRTVTWRAGSGATRSPAVRVNQPGVYTWRVSTRATTLNESARERCARAAQTTTVARPAYPVPVVNGGFSGTLPDPKRDRRAATVLRVPGIGIHATVIPAAVERGQMNLPRTVADVAWLQESARYGDKIGTTVIGGHVSDRYDRPGAMYRLSQVRRGQSVTVTVGEQTHRYKVVSTANYRRGTKLPARYFATTGYPRLVLVSCTDRVVYPNGHFHYTRYQVVVARPVPSKTR